MSSRDILHLELDLVSTFILLDATIVKGDLQVALVAEMPLGFHPIVKMLLNIVKTQLGSDITTFRESNDIFNMH